MQEGREMGLNELRQRLDAIDAQVIALLSERAQVVLTVAEFKRQHRLPVYVPERENAIVERLRAMNPGPLHGDAVERIYRLIIEEMRKFEHEHSVH
jgi:chorismate mutase/prephenate dehydratase